MFSQSNFYENIIGLFAAENVKQTKTINERVSNCCQHL